MPWLVVLLCWFVVCVFNHVNCWNQWCRQWTDDHSGCYVIAKTRWNAHFKLISVSSLEMLMVLRIFMLLTLSNGFSFDLLFIYLLVGGTLWIRGGNRSSEEKLGNIWIVQGYYFLLKYQSYFRSIYWCQLCSIYSNIEVITFKLSAG